MSSPKVVVIGAGSLFFGRQAIWQMVHSEHLNKGTLALVDTHAAYVKKMGMLAEQVVASTGVDLKVEYSTDRREVLKDADFVVLSFADRSVKFRDIDCKLSEKYGIRMCSGDTIGPGGIMRTLREFPRILECCRDIEELCPDAWVINYINPTAANGIGLQIFAPKLKSFALCDGLHMPHVKRNYAIRGGVIGKGESLTPEQDKDFDFRIAGVNHFTWLMKAEYKGEDVVPTIADAIKQVAATETDGGSVGAKAAFNSGIGYALYKSFGYVPTCVGHTKEYVRFYQGLTKSPDPIPPLKLWGAPERYERHAEMWRQVDSFVTGVTPIEDYMSTFGPDHATDIIETMWGGLDKPFFINTPNNGTVPNMQDDAFLEMMCDVSMDGVKPRPVGNAPVGLRGLWQQVLDSHELAARAAVSGDRDLLHRAFVCDPIVSSAVDAEALIEDLLKAEKSALPGHWFE